MKALFITWAVTVVGLCIAVGMITNQRDTSRRERDTYRAELEELKARNAETVAATLYEEDPAFVYICKQEKRSDTEMPCMSFGHWMDNVTKALKE